MTEAELGLIDITICTICGHHMDWRDCWSCGGAGEFSLYDEDPLWYDEDDYDMCDVCQGTGGYWQCINVPHNDEPEGGLL
jgi:hypothetical protein